MSASRIANPLVCNLAKTTDTSSMPIMQGVPEFNLWTVHLSIRICPGAMHKSDSGTMETGVETAVSGFSPLYTVDCVVASSVHPSSYADIKSRPSTTCASTESVCSAVLPKPHCCAEYATEESVKAPSMSFVNAIPNEYESADVVRAPSARTESFRLAESAYNPPLFPDPLL